MSENDNDPKAFGDFLFSLALDAGFFSVPDFWRGLKAFKEKLDAQKKSKEYDKEKAIGQSTVTRWINGSEVPTGKYRGLLIAFFRKELKQSDFHPQGNMYKKFFDLLYRSQSAQQVLRDQNKALDNRPNERIQFTDSEIAEMLNFKDSGELGVFLSNHRHSYETTDMMRRIISIPNKYSDDLKRYLVEIILDCESSQNHIHIASICANVICGIDAWDPSIATVNSLEQKFFSIQRSFSKEKIALVSSISFLIARTKNYEPLKRHLYNMILDKELAKHDCDFVSGYYGSDIKQAIAFLRHFSDPKRSGLMIAHNSHRLVNLLKSDHLKDEKLKKLLIQGIDECSVYLRKSKLDAEANELLLLLKRT